MTTISGLGWTYSLPISISMPFEREFISAGTSHKAKLDGGGGNVSLIQSAEKFDLSLQFSFVKILGRGIL